MPFEVSVNHGFNRAYELIGARWAARLLVARSLKGELCVGLARVAVWWLEIAQPMIAVSGGKLREKDKRERGVTGERELRRRMRPAKW